MPRPRTRMRELLRQVFVHGLIAAVVAQAMLRAWRLEDPAQRLRIRLLGLLLPLAVTPALVWSAPFRGAGPFRDESVLLDTRRYPELQLLGAPLHEWGAALLGAAGVILLLRDLLPLVLEQLPRGAPARLAEAPEAVRASLVELASGLGLATPPPLRLLETSEPALLCSGLRNSTLIVSRGTLELLDPEELRAGLAHELAHVARRDPLLGWLLMGLRLLLATNPAAQLLARAAVRDIETRADDVAAALTQKPLALASGLVKVFRSSAAPSLPLAGWPIPALDGAAGVLRRLRAEALVSRCRRLVDQPHPRRLRFEAVHLAAVAVGLAGILFFVV
jgi:Zn-dependent protease with chaperone function